MMKNKPSVVLTSIKVIKFNVSWLKSHQYSSLVPKFSAHPENWKYPVELQRPFSKR